MYTHLHDNGLNVIYMYIISKFMFLDHRKTVQNVHVTILFFLFAYEECNVIVAKNLICPHSAWYQVRLHKPEHL